MDVIFLRTRPPIISRTLMNKTSWCINSNFLSSTRSFPYLDRSPLCFIIKTPAKTRHPSFTLSTFGNGIIGERPEAHTSQPIGHSYQKMTHFKWQSVLKDLQIWNVAINSEMSYKNGTFPKDGLAFFAPRSRPSVELRGMERLVARGNWNKKIWGVKWKIDEC